MEATQSRTPDKGCHLQLFCLEAQARKMGQVKNLQYSCTFEPVLKTVAIVWLGVLLVMGAVAVS
jgi:hypothetical protein